MTTVHLAGRPVPQGGLIAMHTANGRLRMRNKPSLVDYRGRLAAELARERHGGATLTTAVSVLISVQLDRPAGHYLPANSKRPAPQLRTDAPSWPTGRNSGDVDKLARTVLDALVIAGLLADDSQVVSLQVRKGWADELPAGVHVTVVEVD